MKRIAKAAKRINQLMDVQAMTAEDLAFEEEMAMIQGLIGYGLKAAQEKIQREFAALIGQRYARGKAAGNWGTNPGSIYLGDQKVALEVPRARNPRTGRELRLRTYDRLQSPRLIEDMALWRVINGISMGTYEEAALSIPETFGIKRTSVSRSRDEPLLRGRLDTRPGPVPRASTAEEVPPGRARGPARPWWIRASARKLAALNERDLSKYDTVAIFLDDKHFSTDHEIVVALGVTLQGEKVILGIVETSTENYVVCRDFVRRLRERGLRIDDPILCIIDGGPGIHKGLKEVLGERAVIQRCQWHKRENVLKSTCRRVRGTSSAGSCRTPTSSRRTTRRRSSWAK